MLLLLFLTIFIYFILYYKNYIIPFLNNYEMNLATQQINGKITGKDNKITKTYTNK